MATSSIRSALLATLVATHGSGTPIETEMLLTLAAVQRHEFVEAREALRELRETPILTSHGFQGVELNDDAFEAVVDVLADECKWEPRAIECRLKHYEG